MASDDCMNPSPPSSGFMDLLQSQQETHNLGNSPYESQCSDAPFEATSPQQKRRSRNTWLPADDMMLVSVWLNTSKDPINSNEQRLLAFWERIADYFADCPNAVGRPKRKASDCKQRWGKINGIVCKFVGSYEAAIRMQTSGQNEGDVMKLANQIFFSDHKKKFTLEHVWRELRYDQKWCVSTSTKETGVKRGRACGDASAQPSSSQPMVDLADESMSRLPGVKAAKAAKGKEKNSSNTKAAVKGIAFMEFQMKVVESMYDMKQKYFALKEKEFALKEKHSKHAMLENLIANKDSLTETEKALKDKLIDELLSSISKV